MYVFTYFFIVFLVGSRKKKRKKKVRVVDGARALRSKHTQHTDGNVCCSYACRVWWNAFRLRLEYRFGPPLTKFPPEGPSEVKRAITEAHTNISIIVIRAKAYDDD